MRGLTAGIAMAAVVVVAGVAAFGPPAATSPPPEVVTDPAAPNGVNAAPAPTWTPGRSPAVRPLPAPDPSRTPVTGPDPTPDPTAAPPPTPSARAVPTGPPVLLVRGGGALPGGLTGAVAAVPGVDAVTGVRAGQVGVTRTLDAAGAVIDEPPGGWTLPLDVIAIDPAGYAALLPADQAGPVQALAPGSALLGATSAEVRRLGPGAVLEVGGAAVVVAGVVDDRLVGGAELVVAQDDADRLGVGGLRYVLARAAGDPAEVAGGVRSASAGAQALVSDLGGGAWPVSWREILPQALVKARFGEFAVRPGAGRAAQLDPVWTAASITTAEVPLLGEVTCHRAVIEPLRAALGELERSGLSALVDAGDYAGCHGPRLTGPGGIVSRHAWGLAVDVNASANPYGAPSRQDPRLVEVMERHGFAFGGRWPVPDAMHFEYRGPG